jgi:hypothetical protein
MKIKIKLSKRNVTFVVTLLAIAGFLFYYVFFYPKPIKAWNYRGQVLNFRSDLREADKVPVYPGENQVYLDTMHTLVDNVTIVYKDVGEYGYYAAEAFEITYKMKIAYTNLVGTDIEGKTSDVPTFNAETVDQYAHLPGKIQNPIIALVHPIYANETAVRNEGHVTYISGETFDDLDLATAKFLMIVLGIDLEQAGQSNGFC